MSIRIFVCAGFISIQFAAGCVFAQLPHSMHGIPSVTGAYSINQVDMNSFTVNPATLARLTSAGISFFGERRYLLKELSDQYINASINVGPGNFGAGIHYTGYSLYNELELRFAHGKKLGEQLDIGLQLHMLVVNMQGYGRVSAPGFEFGLMFHPTQKLHAGLKSRDPFGKKWGKGKDKLVPAVYVFGIGYESSTAFLCSLEFSKEENRPAEASARMQYRPHPSFRIRSGVVLFTGTAWFAVGWIRKNMQLDISSAYHPTLGISPGLQMSFQFLRKEK